MGTATPLALSPFHHFVLLLEHFSAQGSEQGVCASVTRHHRLDSPQTKSQKNLWCFPELRIWPYILNVPLAPSRTASGKTQLSSTGLTPA